MPLIAVTNSTSSIIPLRVNHYDVIVLGLGGMGSAAACQLAQRGQRVLGLEQFAPPHDQGSSHGRTRVIRQAYFEHPAYVPLLLRAYELWRELEQKSDTELMLLPGGLMIGAPDSEVVFGSIRSAREHNLPHEILDANEIRRRYPMFQISDDTIALFEEAAGMVYCERAVKAHLQVAAQAGAELHFHEPVIDWQANASGGVTVRTAQGTYTAGQLVISPGPWAPEMLASIGIPLVVDRQVLFWFQPSVGTAAFAPERFPIYIWQPRQGPPLYGFPAVDGPQGGVKISYHGKPSREICTPQSIDRQIRPDDITEIRTAIREFLPSLDGDLVRATVCMYTLTPDQHFVLGEHPEYPQVKMAAGFSGHGFKFCSVIGEVLADLVIDGKSRLDIGLFNPQRFSKTSC